MENVAVNQGDLPLLVLASASPRRKELIQLLGLPVEIAASETDETIEKEWSPAKAVEQLALRKAMEAVRLREPKRSQEIVIGADTIVVCDQQILGKPQSQEDAYRMLSMLQGRAHEVYTGVACINAATGQQIVRHRKTHVWMRALSGEQMTRYILSGEPMDKAGAYGIQGLGAAIVDRIEGCYFTVVGLPVSLLSDMLKMYDIETP